MICVAFCKDVPATEEELTEAGDVAVFYTVWSYEKGAGTEIVFEMVDYIKENMPNVNRFVTPFLHRWHETSLIKNGAVEYPTNETVNFEYETLKHYYAWFIQLKRQYGILTALWCFMYNGKHYNLDGSSK